MNKNFHNKLLNLPNNSYFIKYKNQRYIFTKHTLLDNKLIKIFAENLNDGDIVSGNYYVNIKEGLLKPCEMSDEKVIDFIIKLEVLN